MVHPFLFTLLLDTLKILTILILIILIYYSRTYLHWHHRNVPYIVPLPFFGNFFNVLTLQRDIFHHGRDLYNKMHFKYFGIWIFDRPMLILKDPDLIKSVLVNDCDHFEERTVKINPEIDEIGSKMLFFAKAPYWKVARREIMSEFNLKKHKRLIPRMQNALDQIMTTNLMSEQKLSVDAKDLFLSYSASILGTCIFGADLNMSNDFKNIGQTMFKLDINNAIRGTSHFFAPWLANLFKMSFAKPAVNNGLQNILIQTIEQRINNEMHQNEDYIDALIKIEHDFVHKYGLSKDNSRPAAYAIQFFLAGIESISSTIAFTLYELCLNVKIQEKLRTEIKTQIEEYEIINYECLISMRYLHNCISETLRKYPTLPFIDRLCTKTYRTAENGGTIIEKGTRVYIFLLGLHYDPKYFPEPEKYDPDRFTEDNKEGRSQYTYLAFGHGPHSCTGQRFSLISVKLALVNILLNYEIRRNEDTPVPLQFDPQCFLLKSKRGLPMDFIKLGSNIL